MGCICTSSPAPPSAFFYHLMLYCTSRREETDGRAEIALRVSPIKEIYSFDPDSYEYLPNATQQQQQRFFSDKNWDWAFRSKRMIIRSDNGAFVPLCPQRRKAKGETFRHVIGHTRHGARLLATQLSRQTVLYKFALMREGKTEDGFRLLPTTLSNAAVFQKQFTDRSSAKITARRNKNQRPQVKSLSPSMRNIFHDTAAFLYQKSSLETIHK